MLGQTFVSPLWSQFNLTSQTVETIPDYDNGLVYLVCVALAVASSVQVFCMTASMQYNTVGMVSVLMYMTIPLGYFLDFLFLDGAFGQLELVGAAIICFFNIGIAVLRIKGCIE